MEAWVFCTILVVVSTVDGFSAISSGQLPEGPLNEMTPNHNVQDLDDDDILNSSHPPSALNETTPSPESLQRGPSPVSTAVRSGAIAITSPFNQSESQHSGPDMHVGGSRVPNGSFDPLPSDPYSTKGTGTTPLSSVNVNGTTEYYCQPGSIPSLNGQPEPKWSCKNRCTDVAKFGAKANEHLCSCDDLCHMYGDCCIDFDRHCSELLQPSFDVGDPMCVDRRLLFGAKCAEDYHVGTVIEACLSPSENSTDLTYRIPVYDNRTGLHFKNVFCAVCNRANNVTFWTTSFECTNRTDIRANLSRHNFADDLLSLCHLSVRSPPPFPERRCHDQAKGTCSSACSSNPDLVENCRKYTRLVKDTQLSLIPGEYIYNNPYCAMCNGAQYEYIREWPKSKDELSAFAEGSIIPGFSYTILMDFSPKGGLHVGVVEVDLKTQTREDKGTFSCDVNTAVTLTAKGDERCLALQCPREYELRDRDCVPKARLIRINVIFLGIITRPPSSTFDMEVSEMLEKIGSRLQKVIETRIDVYGNVSWVYGDDDTGKRAFEDIPFSMSCSFHVMTPDTGKDKFCNQIQTNGSVLMNIYLAASSENANLFENTSLENVSINCTEIYTDAGNKAQNDLSQDEMCPKLSLDNSDFALWQNGSALLSNGLVLQPDEFVVENSSLLFCAEKLLKYNQGTHHHVNGTSYRGRITTEKGILTIVCLCVSMASLLGRICLQGVVKTFQTFPGKLQFCLSLAMFLSKLSFLLGPPLVGIYEACVPIALLLHWSTLTSFFWMNVIAIDMWRRFHGQSLTSINGRSHNGFRAAIYGIYALGMPTLIVVSSVVFDFADLGLDSTFRPGFGLGPCWFTQKYPLILFFVAPLAVIIVVNVILYVLCSISIYSAIKDSSKKLNKNSSGHNFCMYVKLLALTGSTWALGLIAGGTQNEIAEYFFAVLAASDGFFVFLSTVCTRLVIRDLKKVYCRRLSQRERRRGENCESRMSQSTDGVTLSTNHNHSHASNTSVHEKGTETEVSIATSRI
ncbi:uncharacterized protein LOC106178022 [Lingula anatina]|uniref:Uncharacterized protein LOC106178022 n=1 Tax=Lingula anatina TaxID=7574 RepID=A0A1S3K2H9_LINAN|nr:uncharacterized protein LOC106178022 [Lingula anatina]|eukprot:XP_013416471.2 uncharacterized protein LOC106178022 [Lingula anatina]